MGNVASDAWQGVPPAQERTHSELQGLSPPLPRDGLGFPFDQCPQLVSFDTNKSVCVGLQDDKLRRRGRRRRPEKRWPWWDRWWWWWWRKTDLLRPTWWQSVFHEIGVGWGRGTDFALGKMLQVTFFHPLLWSS